MTDKHFHRTFYLFIAGFFLFCGSSFAEFHPDSFTWNIWVDGERTTSRIEIYSELEQHYSNHLGAYPDVIVWDNTNDPIRITWVFRGVVRQTIQDMEQWNSSDDWIEIAKSFSYHLTSLKSKQFISIPVAIDTSKANLQLQYYNLIGSFELDARSLPLPKDGSAWKLELVIKSSEVPDSIVANLEKPIYIARIDRDTAEDSLEWAYRGQHLNDKKVLIELLNIFPNFTPLYRPLFKNFQAEKDCANMRKWGQKWHEAILLDKFPFTEIGQDSTIKAKSDLRIGYENADGSVTYIDTVLDYIHQSLKVTCNDTTLYK